MARIKEYCGRYILEINNGIIKEYCGRNLFEIYSNKVKRILWKKSFASERE